MVARYLKVHVVNLRQIHQGLVVAKHSFQVSEISSHLLKLI